jgi:hypothetical protein
MCCVQLAAISSQVLAARPFGVRATQLMPSNARTLPYDRFETISTILATACIDFWIGAGLWSRSGRSRRQRFSQPD